MALSEHIKKILKYAFTIGLVVVSFYFILKQISIKDLLSGLKRINYFWIVLSIIPAMLSHWIRAYRWKVFLKPQECNLETKSLFSAVMIGYFFNSVTLRLGEIVRPYIVSVKSKIPLSTSGATIFLERIMDMLFLVIFFIYALFIKKEFLIKSQNSIDINQMLLVFGAIVVFVAAVLNFKRISRFIKANVTFLSQKKNIHKPLSYINSKMMKFADGFESIKSPKLYAEITYLSLAIWILYVFPNYFMLIGMNFDVTYNLNFNDAVVILVFSGLAISFSPTPGAIGLYHAIVAETLVLFYSFNRIDAYTFATISHLFNYSVQLIIGGYYFALEKNSLDLSYMKNLLNKDKAVT